MILSNELTAIGILIKPHGIKGEITMRIDCDIDVESLQCIVLNMDGIYVPFFIDSTRPRSSESVLISVSGIDSENKAQELCGKDVFALKKDLQDLFTDDDSDRFYLSDLVGFSLKTDDDFNLGIIEDYDDSTENWLLIVKNAQNTIYIPIVEEFIVDIDYNQRILTMNLPEGLVDLN